MAIAAARIEPLAIGSSFQLDRADVSHFEPLVGEAFTVFPGDGSARVRVRLASVRQQWSTAKVSQFSLIFHGSASNPLAQGIHEFRHQSLGSFSIFISPVGVPTGEQRAFQACFGRHVRT